MNIVVRALPDLGDTEQDPCFGESLISKLYLYFMFDVLLSYNTLKKRRERSYKNGNKINYIHQMTCF